MRRCLLCLALALPVAIIKISAAHVVPPLKKKQLDDHQRFQKSKAKKEPLLMTLFEIIGCVCVKPYT